VDGFIRERPAKKFKKKTNNFSSITNQRPANHARPLAELIVHWPTTAKTDSSGSRPDFLTFVWWRTLWQSDGIEPQRPTSRLIRIACNPTEPWRVVMKVQRRMAVVGDIDTGKKTQPRRPTRPMMEGTTGTETQSRKTERQGICGAMSQQCGDSGHANYSVPQELLQLVGCRDSKAWPEPWVRPRPLAGKQ
jgi:hypothetical protein